MACVHVQHKDHGASFSFALLPIEIYQIVFAYLEIEDGHPVAQTCLSFAYGWKKYGLDVVALVTGPEENLLRFFGHCPAGLPCEFAVARVSYRYRRLCPHIFTMTFAVNDEFTQDT